MTAKNKALKNDRYKKVRGGSSKLLNISCAKCGAHICNYQKDGPGALRRMYVDRIQSSHEFSDPGLNCPHCQQLLGTRIIYQRESRPAYRLINGTFSKQLAK